MQQPASELNNQPQTFKARVAAQYERYREYGPAAFFFGGFFFDILTLARIDDTLTIVQQAVYLFLLSTFSVFELCSHMRPLQVPKGLQTLWKYRDEIVHFVFGSLLSVYTLFYFKSSSLVTSFVFLAALAGLMVANEFSRFQQSGVLTRLALLSVCFISYLSYVIPVFIGQIGLWIFLLALIGGTLPMLWILKIAERRAPEVIRAEPQDVAPRRYLLKNWRSQPLYKRSRQIVWLVPTVFLTLYLLQLVPPVPLSAQFLGIYHEIEKVEGRYQLKFDRPWWAFWENGAQTFYARPGDKIYVFASIFSPTNFQDRINMRWQYYDEKQGWQTSDRIPLQVTGGRDLGFRAFAQKSSYSPGRWRVIVETSDAREISRINLRVVADPSQEPREFKIDTL